MKLFEVSMTEKKEAVVTLMVLTAQPVLALVAVCLGLLCSGVNAQERNVLPGLLKRVMPRANGAAPDQAEKNEAGGVQAGAASEQPRAAQESRPNNPPVAAQGAINFQKKAVTGAFVLDPAQGQPYRSTIYGRFMGGGYAGDYFQIYAFDQDGNIIVELKFEDSLENLAKVPRTYTFKRRRDKSPNAVLVYRGPAGSGVVCGAMAGTLTVTGFAGVEGLVTGTISDVEWISPDCASVAGVSASFKVPRSVDFQLKR